MNTPQQQEKIEQQNFDFKTLKLTRIDGPPLAISTLVANANRHAPMNSKKNVGVDESNSSVGTKNTGINNNIKKIRNSGKNIEFNTNGKNDDNVSKNNESEKLKNNIKNNNFLSPFTSAPKRNANNNNNNNNNNKHGEQEQKLFRKKTSKGFSGELHASMNVKKTMETNQKLFLDHSSFHSKNENKNEHENKLVVVDSNEKNNTALLNGKFVVSNNNIKWSAPLLNQSHENNDNHDLFEKNILIGNNAEQRPRSVSSSSTRQKHRVTGKQNMHAQNNIGKKNVTNESCSQKSIVLNEKNVFLNEKILDVNDTTTTSSIINRMNENFSRQVSKNNLLASNFGNNAQNNVESNNTENNVDKNIIISSLLQLKQKNKMKLLDDKHIYKKNVDGRSKKITDKKVLLINENENELIFNKKADFDSNMVHVDDNDFVFFSSKTSHVNNYTSSAAMMDFEKKTFNEKEELLVINKNNNNMNNNKKNEKEKETFQSNIQRRRKMRYIVEEKLDDED